MRKLTGPIHLLLLLVLFSQFAAAEPYRELNKSNPGQRFELRDYMSRKPVNVVVFFSEYSQPSTTLLRSLEMLAEADPDLAVEYLNIDRTNASETDWKSPLARQYRVNILPHVLIYQDKELQSQGHQARRDILRRMDQASR